MTVYSYELKTKWGWRTELSSNKRHLKSERSFAKRHGYKVGPIRSHTGKTTRIEYRRK